MDISLRQLEAFIKVAEHRSFSKAGDELFLSQSTISSHVAQLEQSLQVTLIKRREKKNIELTEEGQRAYRAAQIIINQAEMLQNMFRKEEAAVTDWTEDTNAICANRQSEILTSAAKMLRPGGRLIYAVPGPEHLFQMKAVLYEKPYKNPVQEVEYPGFEAVGEREVSGRITVPAGQLEALFAMTPYYWKTPRDGAARLAALPELTTDISFRFLVFEKK